jgi:hypothetical protein
MDTMLTVLRQWQLDVRAVRDRCTVPRHHASVSAGMPPGCWREVGPRPRWRNRFRRMRTPLVIGSKPFEDKDQPAQPLSRAVPPPVLNSTEQAELKAVVQDTPRAAGIDLASRNWKVVRLFVKQHFGRKLYCSSCVNYLHRLGFALKRPRKRLLKAMLSSGMPLSRLMPRCALRRSRRAPRSFSWTKPTSGPMPTCGPNGCGGRAYLGRHHQSQAGRESHLRFGPLPGDRRGGTDVGDQQLHRRDIDYLPSATAG